MDDRGGFASPGAVLAQPKQPGPGRGKAAAAVEGLELRLIIDMQPFGTALTRRFGDAAHQLGRDTAAAEIGMHRRIEQERMDAAVLGDVDEADQRPAGTVPDRAVAEAALQHIGITGPERRAPRGTPQPIEFGLDRKTIELEGGAFHHSIEPPVSGSCNLTNSTKVIPAEAGIQFLPGTVIAAQLDSRLRGNDVVLA